jgi:teichoic acid ribitol-phosphate primase
VSGLVVVARIWLIRLVYFFASRLPLRRKVVLATAQKARIDGNLACIHAELQARLPARAIKVVAYRPSRGLLGMLRTALDELRAVYQLATARVFIVDAYFFPLYPVRKRPGTTVIQTWHAPGPVKRTGLGVAEKDFGVSEAVTSRLRIHTNYDAILTGSRHSAELYSEAFGQPTDLFVTHLGIPRTDLLFGEERMVEARRRVSSRLSIPADRRVVLYAPTYRGDSIEARFPELMDFDLLKETLGADHVVLVRKHPFVRAPLRFESQLAGFVVDASDYPEINELMQVADVLVTDYSSSIYDFAILERPIAFFTPDHEEYLAERGFFLDYRTEGPGPVFETTRELADWLRAGDFDLDRVRQFRDKWFEVADGRSTRRVTDQLVLPALKGDLA